MDSFYRLLKVTYCKRLMIQAALSILLIAPEIGLGDGGNKQANELILDRFLLHENGSLIEDTKTNLLWMRCMVGQVWDQKNNRCDGPPIRFTWDGVNNISADYGGFSDWRIPRINEMRTISVCVPLRAGLFDDQWRGDFCDDGYREFLFPGVQFSAYWGYSLDMSEGYLAQTSVTRYLSRMVSVSPANRSVMLVRDMKSR